MTPAPLPAPASQTVFVRRPSDVARVQRTIRVLAHALGFSEVNEFELAIAASELAQNLLHHTTAGGMITWHVITGDQGQGIEVICEDKGPGIVDIDQAMQDGFSTRGSLGGGLGAARRLSDHFDIRPGPESGLIIQLKKWR